MRFMTGRAGGIAVASALIGALAVALGGCVAQLRPAPGAVVLPGPGQAAIAEAGGVRIVASADAWRGDPESLDQVVTPMLVRVENDGTAAVQVRYEDFALVADDGRRFAAIPPFDVRGVVSTLNRVYPVYGFRVSPFYSAFYPHLAVAPGAYPFDPFYYDAYWPYWHRWVNLPTGDMVQKALPEGVLQPGGRATGFLYFEDVDKARRLTFQARLPVRDTNDQTVSITIPFVVD
jgi:hypothetical protein